MIQVHQIMKMTIFIMLASETTKKDKRIIKRNYGCRKDVLEIEKERLQESKNLRKSLDDMVQIQKERKILAEISQCLKKIVLKFMYYIFF